MSGQAMIRCGILLAGFLLGAGSVAQARIAQPEPARGGVLNANGLSENPRELANPPVAVGAEVSRTITLNFGPLHFQEVLRATPQACRS